MDSEFIHSPLSSKTHCHASSIIPLKNGEYALVYYVYPDSEIKSGAIALSRTRGGKWEKPAIIQEASGLSLGNPVVFEDDQGLLHFIYSSIDTGYWDSAELRYIKQISDKNFSSPCKVNTPSGTLVRHPPIRSLDGSWILPCYDEKTMTSQILASTDNFGLWSMLYSFPEESIIQPQILRLADKSLICFFRPMNERNSIYFARSHDDGKSWSAITDTKLPCPKSGISATTDGTSVYLIYNHNEDMKRYPLSLSSSSGDFSQWTSPWTIDGIRFELSYPSFIYDQGSLLGTYTYNRRMIKRVKFSPKESQIQASDLAKKEILDFKDKHRDKSLFIIASGPSIKELDLGALDRRITMGLNRSFLKYDNTYYHCMFDQRLFDDYEAQLKDHRCLFTLEDRPWGVQIQNLGAEGFEHDLSKGIYTGYTISYFALQLAVYMGFKKIFFLGLDLNNPVGQTHFFGYDHHSANHNQTEFPKMLNSFERAAKTLQQVGVEVYNCSIDSKLQAFPKITFEKAIEIS